MVFCIKCRITVGFCSNIRFIGKFERHLLVGSMFRECRQVMERGIGERVRGRERMRWGDLTICKRTGGLLHLEYGLDASHPMQLHQMTLDLENCRTEKALCKGF